MKCVCVCYCCELRQTFIIWRAVATTRKCKKKTSRPELNCKNNSAHRKKAKTKNKNNLRLIKTRNKMKKKRNKFSTQHTLNVCVYMCVVAITIVRSLSHPNQLRQEMISVRLFVHSVQFLFMCFDLLNTLYACLICDVYSIYDIYLYVYCCCYSRLSLSFFRSVCLLCVSLYMYCTVHALAQIYLLY